MDDRWSSLDDAWLDDGSYRFIFNSWCKDEVINLEGSAMGYLWEEKWGFDRKIHHISCLFKCNFFGQIYLFLDPSIHVHRSFSCVDLLLSFSCKNFSLFVCVYIYQSGFWGSVFLLYLQPVTIKYTIRSFFYLVFFTSLFSIIRGVYLFLFNMIIQTQSVICYNYVFVL